MPVAKLIEHVEAHYDVQQLEFGRVYRWHSGSVLVECECGEMVGTPLLVRRNDYIPTYGRLYS